MEWLRKKKKVNGDQEYVKITEVKLRREIQNQCLRENTKSEVNG